MFDPQCQEAIAHLVGEKLGPIVGLQALDREGCLLQHVVQELQRVSGGAPWVERGDEIARAVIHEGVLIQPRREFHRVHLCALTRQAHAVAFGNQWTFRPAHGWGGMACQGLVDGLERQEAHMLPAQLVLDPARAELSFAAQRQDPAFFLFKDFLVRAAMRTTTP